MKIGKKIVLELNSIRHLTLALVEKKIQSEKLHTYKITKWNKKKEEKQTEKSVEAM